MFSRKMSKITWACRGEAVNMYLEPDLAKNVSFFSVLRSSKGRILNIQAQFGKTTPNFRKSLFGNVNLLKKPRKIPQFCNNSGTMSSELAHEQKHATWKFWNQDEANIGRQDDPPKVGFPIGFERFLPLNLNSFFDRFGNGLIFVKMPKLMRKQGPKMPGSPRTPRENNALRKKLPKGYMSKKNVKRVHY